MFLMEKSGSSWRRRGAVAAGAAVLATAGAVGASHVNIFPHFRKAELPILFACPTGMQPRITAGEPSLSHQTRLLDPVTRWPINPYLTIHCSDLLPSQDGAEYTAFPHVTPNSSCPTNADPTQSYTVITFKSNELPTHGDIPDVPSVESTANNSVDLTFVRPGAAGEGDLTYATQAC